LYFGIGTRTLTSMQASIFQAKATLLQLI
jgi:hypothetical protein